MLFQAPDQLNRLIAHPELIDTVIEESLRSQSPLQIGNRVTTADLELGGKKYPQELIFIYQLREQIGIQKNSLNQKELISLENPIDMLHLQWGIMSAWGLH